MNQFAQALKFNAPAKATPSTLKALDILSDVASTHPDPELILCAFRLLSASEPHRIPMLAVSVREGRAVDVVKALAVYLTADRLDAHHRKVGKTLRSC